MVETGVEAATAVHHCGLLGQLLQDASSPGGRGTRVRYVILCSSVS